MIALALILFELSPLRCFFYACLCLLCNLNSLWNIIMIPHSYVEQVMTICHIEEWQLSHWYFLSYFPLMVSDAILCPLHNLKTVWNIIMILDGYVEQVMTICRVQDWQLSLSYFLSYFPLMVSDAVSCPLHNLKTVWNILMVLGHVDVSHTRMATLAVILSELFPLDHFSCSFVSAL